MKGENNILEPNFKLLHTLLLCMWFNPKTFTASYTMTIFLNTKVARAVIKQTPTPTFSNYSECFHSKWTYQFIMVQ